jgi:hypothetical protein
VDSCRHGAKGTMPVPIASADLITDGFDLEVRLGGPTGTVLASKRDARYPGGIKRRTLCGGLKMNFADTEPVAYVTYFLDVAGAPSSRAQPSGVTVCRAEDWLSRVPSTEEGRRLRTAIDDNGMKQGNVRSVGDLTGDGLPEYEISYTYSATGWGMTILSSTGGSDCFHSIYEGEGSISSVTTDRTDGWNNITIGYSSIVGDQGRGVVTVVARRDGATYKFGEIIDCKTLGGDVVPLDACRRTMAP